MKTSLIILLILASGLCSIGFLAAETDKEEATKMKKLMEFDSETEAPEWFSVNDGVMGGLSTGEPTIKHGTLHFRGRLSLENKGGFSSIRTNGVYNFSGKNALLMRVKGDGRTYELRLQTDARYQGSAIAYGTQFKTEKAKWIEVKVPFKSLSPSWRGRNLDGPPLSLSDVEQIGLFLGDKKAGRFVLEVDWIAVE